MSEIIKFYKNESNLSGYFIKDILEKWDDESWSSIHNFVQWIFPLKEPSDFNPDAPILTDEDIKVLKNNKNLFFAFNRFMKFLGLGTIYSTQPPYRMEIVQEKEGNWVFNHNFLRITRCLASLKMLGMKEHACALFDCLTVLKDKYNISENTYKYWADAVLDYKPLENKEIEDAKSAVENGQSDFKLQEIE